MAKFKYHRAVLIVDGAMYEGLGKTPAAAKSAAKKVYKRRTKKGAPKVEMEVTEMHGAPRSLS